jgi:hypothetical protein
MLHSNMAGLLATVHVPGVDNVLADVASCPAKAQKMFLSETPMSDTDFCSSFDIAFPLPDNQAWTLAEVPQWMKLCVFETLRGKRLDLRWWTGPSVTVTGKHGWRTAGSTPRVPDQTPQHAKKPTDSSCCCRRAGRQLRPRRSSQGSVSRAGSAACRPKACSGRTP